MGLKVDFIFRKQKYIKIYNEKIVYSIQREDILRNSISLLFIVKTLDGNCNLTVLKNYLNVIINVFYCNKNRKIIMFIKIEIV